MNLEEFEKKTKEDLKKRSIQPSEEHWSQLKAALDQNKKPRPPYYRWMGSAAAVVLLLLLGKLYFYPDAAQQNLQAPSTEKMVTAPPPLNKKRSEETKISVSKKVIPQQIQNDTAPIEKNVTPDNQSKNKKTSIAKTEAKKAIQDAHSDRISQKNTLISPKNVRIEKDSLSDLAVQDEKNTILSPEEEAVILLREALYKEFLSQMKKEKDSTQMVAYGEELLQEANLNLEREEDQAFRKKVKEVLQKSWNKAKSAIVDAQPSR